MAQAGTSRCAFCSAYHPRHLMHPQRVLKGFQGRRKNGTVMVCTGCKSGQGQGGQAYEDHQQGMVWVAIIGIGIMLIITIIALNVRGY